MELTSEDYKKIDSKKRKAEDILRNKKIINSSIIPINIQCENFNSDFLLNKIEINKSQNKFCNANSILDEQLLNSHNTNLHKFNNNLSNYDVKTNEANSINTWNKNENLYSENVSKSDLHPINIINNKSFVDKIKIKLCLISNERFQVSCPYKPHIIEIFKTIKTKQFDLKTKIWNFDLKDYILLKKNLLEKLKDQIDIDDLPKFVTAVFMDRIKGSNTSLQIPSANLSKVDEKLVRTLHPFQKLAINFGIHQNGRLMIADDMGLGKTLQAICLAEYYKDEWPLLIISPSSVRFNWQQQILMWLPSIEACDVNVALKTKDIESFCRKMVNICSYDLMSRCCQSLLTQNFKVVIVDESHCLKNLKAIRTKNALKILQKAKRVILLSGTPALSRPIELYPQLLAINPHDFSNFKEYASRYCDAKETSWGWDYTGSSNLNELKIIMENKYIIRRMKKDVLHELPSKCRTMVLLDPNAVKLDTKKKKVPTATLR